MRSKSITITTDAAGAASESLSFPTSELKGIRVDNAASGGMTGGTINTSNMGRECMNDINPSSDSYIPIREQAKDKDGSAIAGEYVPFMVHGSLAIVVAGAGDTKTATLTFFYE